MSKAPIRVLVVDDSRTTRAFLTSVLEADAAVTVVGEAGNGVEAVELTRKLRPSLVVMDIDMPVMDGFEATKRIMIEQPTPIIVVSARYDVHQVEVGLRAVRAGALTVIPKPTGMPGPEARDQADRLVLLVKAMAEVRVVRQHDANARGRIEARPRSARTATIVGVAASTGGPAALYRFLESLPRTLDAPVLVVQHLAHGFVDGLARWLSGATVLPVCTAQHGRQLVGGEVLLAPDDRHLEVRGDRVHLSDADAIGGFRPSANALFRSLAETYGPKAAAVVLTGMGTDGVAGATTLRAAGGVVLAQDADSSVVFGMPRAVADAGLAQVVGPVDDLASWIARFCARKEES